MAAIDPLILVLLLVLLVVASISLALILRNRLAFRIGMRNVRRGGSRTALLILGLVVGTTIISGSFVVGDTVGQLNLHYTYLAVGLNDETIYNETPTGGFAYFPYSVYTAASNALSGDRAIAGISPEIIGVTSVFDRSTGIPQTNLNLIGVNGTQSAQLGPFATTAGQSLSGAAPGEVLLDVQAASQLGASAGDRVEVFGAGAVPVAAVVQAIVHDDLRGAFITGGIGGSGNVFVDLPMAQSLSNASGAINYLSVTNIGSQTEGVSASDSISARLNATLAAIPMARGLLVHETLKDDLATAVSGGQSLLTLFFVLGLFSIVAGVMLIVGIFVMLAEERKGEMGMLRAIGLRRRQLIYALYFEGLAYSAGSALAGTFLGVLVGYGLTYAFSVLLPTAGLSQAAVLQSFTVTDRSLVTAYVLGFLLTIVTVALASRRASRLNIVRAIRDIPEPRPPVRLYTYLAYLGAVVAALGALIFLPTYRGSTDLSLPVIGGAMIILGAALVASRFVRNRIVFSAAGAAFLLWAGAEPVSTAVLGNDHTGGIFIVFVDGIIMVMGALLLYIFNSVALLGAISRLTRGSSRREAVVRVALSYPARQPTRTTINLAIFALVIFTLVAIATFGATIQANLDSTVKTESGGYTFFGFSTAPIPDLPGRVAANASLAPLFSAVVPLVSGGATVNVTGYAKGPYGDVLFAAPAGQGTSSSFYATNRFPFSVTLHGMGAASIMAELQTNRTVAILDHRYAAATTNLANNGGFPGPPHPVVAPGDSVGIVNPQNGNHTTVTVIGILSESFVNGVWLNPATASALGYHEEEAFFLSVEPGVSPTHAAQLAKSAFFPYGLVLFDFLALLSSSLSITEGFIGLLQIFVGLGLAVGIAAMGIVALRAVVERRREIGMLRASGFTERMILKSFLLEYSFVCWLGIAIGTALGILIVYDLSLTPSAATAGVSMLAIPWTNLAIILSLTYALALASVAAPSLRAARLPPAEAVRPTE